MVSNLKIHRSYEKHPHREQESAASTYAKILVTTYPRLSDASSLLCTADQTLMILCTYRKQNMITSQVDLIYCVAFTHLFSVVYWLPSKAGLPDCQNIKKPNTPPKKTKKSQTFHNSKPLYKKVQRHTQMTFPLRDAINQCERQISQFSFSVLSCYVL